MSTFEPDQNIPPTVSYKGYVRNGKVPSATYVAQCAKNTNHIAAYRKKHIFTHGRDLANMVGGSPSNRDFAFAYAYTGYGTARLEFQVGIQFTTTLAANSRIAIKVTKLSDSSTQTIYFYTGNLDATPHIVDSPARINWLKKGVNVSENTAYGIEIEEQNYARLVACCAFEVGTLPVDSTTVSGIDEAFAATGAPIFDSNTEDVNVAQTGMWQKNGAVLAWYSHDAANYSYNSTTYRNVVDRLSTSVASTTPGWSFDLRYHAVKSQVTVPLRIAVLARRNSGGGTVANNKARFVNSNGDSIEVTGINDTKGWFTADATLPVGSGVDKYDLQFATDASDTCIIIAASLLSYE